VRFAVDLIKEYGINAAKKDTHLITEFNSDKAAIILNRMRIDEKATDFLYLLSEFEFISLDSLFSIVSEDDYSGLLNEFIASSICDFIGIEKEYIRLNDTIRDFVRRNQLSLPEAFQDRVNRYLNQFLEDSNEEERDISDVIYCTKEMIKKGPIVRDKYLIPSYFLRSMRELYQERGHLERVIELAFRLLEKEDRFDEIVVQDIRYYLCLSLARQRDKRMLEEVQKIRGVEHDFLLGFYYRLQGRWGDAIERLEKCVDEPSVAQRARNELVRVLISIEDYENARALAEDNYLGNRSNPFHIQAYFYTIINSAKANEKASLLLKLVEEISAIPSELGHEMSLILQAEYYARIVGDYDRGLAIIDDAITGFPNSIYPLITKASLAANHKDVASLKKTYDIIEKWGDRAYENARVKIKAYMLVHEGKLREAIRYAETNLRYMPDYSRRSFCERLEKMSG
jgi:tetratricopeptide (TPR) repeat protein